jgi:DNA topoisomerase I
MWILYGGGKKQWTVLRHNGPFFPEEYKKHNIPIIYNNNKIILPDLAEEYATLYARYLDTEYVNNIKFNKNFFKDFKKVLPENLKINDLYQIDFSLIKKYLDKISETKKNITKEEKEKIKAKNAEIEEPYKNCVIDGTNQKVGNYKIEPPGIFLGRGEHPKIGMIKRRIYPEDVTINLDKQAPVPEPNLKDHKWGKVIHDREVIWLATWKDTITGKSKYIFTSMGSTFKSKSDEKKFDLARRLKRKAKEIRTKYEEELRDDDIKIKQLATALYFIDNLALRVGGKKNKKEKADTVGVTSLRVEHLTLIPPNTIKLDFLGKDSIRYCKKVNVLNDVYRNLESFINNKDKKESLFDKINSNMLNEYLNSFLKNLTAKVWRTYNASLLFQKELDKIRIDRVLKIPESERINYIISLFQQANTSVALLCNHQKAVTTNLDNALDKIKERIKKYRKQKRTTTDKMKKTKSKDAKKNYKERILKINAKIKLLKIKMETKSKMKNVSLGTSKTNYIDPRIIFAFMKKFEIPVEKLFTKTLEDRFDWASSVDKDYRF